MNPTFLFIDFQTTGTVAEASHIIEAGWGYYDPLARYLIGEECGRIIRLPEGEELSRTIQRLTGISAADFEEAQDPAEMRAELGAFLRSHPTASIVLHYATFKVPFLKKALAGQSDLLESLDARIICTHRLSKQKIPELKSHSLRAVAGHIGYSAAEKKRVADHLRATAFVWRFLQDGTRGEVERLGIAREQRLGLPQNPGIYFFRDEHGRVLYVGKALNLKGRVNSYFRGRKTKGSRLNEMLTRASSLDVRECASELEALLREADAIKEHDPPYNRMLRKEERALLYFRAEDVFGIKQGGRSWGPLSSPWDLQFLQETWAILQADSQQDLLETCRRIWRDRPLELAEEDEETESEEEVVLSNLEDVAAMIESMVLNFLRTLRRSRFFLRLLYADVIWPDLTLSLRASRYAFHLLPWEKEQPDLQARAAFIDRALCDRLTIVLMHIRKSLRRGEDVKVRFSERLVLDNARLLRYFS